MHDAEVVGRIQLQGVSMEHRLTGCVLIFEWVFVRQRLSDFP